MKKFITIAAVAITFTACSSGTNEPCTNCATDSTKVKVDTAVIAVDSTGTPIIDTTVIATDSTE